MTPGNGPPFRPNLHGRVPPPPARGKHAEVTEDSEPYIVVGRVTGDLDDPIDPRYDRLDGDDIDFELADDDLMLITAAETREKAAKRYLWVIENEATVEYDGDLRVLTPEDIGLTEQEIVDMAIEQLPRRYPGGAS